MKSGQTLSDLFETAGVPAATLQQVLDGPDGPETAGGVYMQALADSLSASIRTHALDQGARQVMVANIPAITYTPLFQFVLDRIGFRG